MDISPSTARSGRRSHSASAETGPLGIKNYCVLTIIGSVIVFFLALAGRGAGGPAAAIAGLLLVLAGVNFVGVIGLWYLEYWGWVIVVTMASINIVLELVQGELLALLIGGALLAYISSKRDLYRR